jgi:hypothetical protein
MLIGLRRNECAQLPAVTAVVTSARLSACAHGARDHPAAFTIPSALRAIRPRQRPPFRICCSVPRSSVRVRARHTQLSARPVTRASPLPFVCGRKVRARGRVGQAADTGLHGAVAVCVWRGSERTPVSCASPAARGGGQRERDRQRQTDRQRETEREIEREARGCYDPVARGRGGGNERIAPSVHACAGVLPVPRSHCREAAPDPPPPQALIAPASPHLCRHHAVDRRARRGGDAATAAALCSLTRRCCCCCCAAAAVVAVSIAARRPGASVRRRVRGSVESLTPSPLMHGSAGVAAKIRHVTNGPGRACVRTCACEACGARAARGACERCCVRATRMRVCARACVRHVFTLSTSAFSRIHARGNLERQLAEHLHANDTRMRMLRKRRTKNAQRHRQLLSRYVRLNN